MSKPNKPGLKNLLRQQAIQATKNRRPDVFWKTAAVAIVIILAGWQEANAKVVTLKCGRRAECNIDFAGNIVNYCIRDGNKDSINAEITALNGNKDGINSEITTTSATMLWWTSDDEYYTFDHHGLELRVYGVGEDSEGKRFSSISAKMNCYISKK
jgi:hypothetical protein